MRELLVCAGLKAQRVSVKHNGPNRQSRELVDILTSIHGHEFDG